MREEGLAALILTCRGFASLLRVFRGRYEAWVCAERGYALDQPDGRF